jgi:hypothetical protein
LLIAALAITVTTLKLTAPVKKPAGNSSHNGTATDQRKFQDEAKQNLMLRKFISYTNTRKILVR